MFLSGITDTGSGIKLLEQPVRIITNDNCNTIFFITMPRAGVEPARGCPRGILSPLRLPIPPPGRLQLFRVDSR